MFVYNAKTLGSTIYVNDALRCTTKTEKEWTEEREKQHKLLIKPFDSLCSFSCGDVLDLFWQHGGELHSIRSGL